MSTLNVVLIILTILVVLLAVLYFVGRRLQKKQTAQQEQLEAAKQVVPMLIIDKKKMRIKDAGLPQAVFESTPKLMRRAKLPIVKAKVGPRVMTFIADARVFEMLPVKKEVKATISGLYITDAKGVRGVVLEPPKKKEGVFKRMKSKVTRKDKKEQAAAAKEAPVKNKAPKETAQKSTAPSQNVQKNTAASSAQKKSGSRKKKK